MLKIIKRFKYKVKFQVLEFWRCIEMLFWFYMLIICLLIPFTMIGFGKSFLKNAPQKINTFFGYRTTMSMKNKDTWIFAHKYCGKIWLISGLIMLPISILIMVLIFNNSKGIIGMVGVVLCVIQTVPIFLSVLFTEKALKKFLIKMEEF